MNCLPLPLPIFMFLFSLAIITSCKTEDSVSSQKGNKDISETVQLNHPQIVDSQDTETVDNVCFGLQDKLGNLWFGTTGEGVYYFNGDTLKNYTIKDGLNSNHVKCIIEDKRGNILFGTDRGVCRHTPTEDGIAGKTFLDITQNTVLSQGDIACLFEDQTGRLWISALGDGTYLYDQSAEQTSRKTITKLLPNDSLENDTELSLSWINCILEDRAGNIWFAAWRDEGLGRYDGKSLSQFRFNRNSQFSTDKGGFYVCMFRSVLEDKNGKLWFGTQLNGLFSYDPLEDDTNGARQPRFVNVTQDTRLSNACIYSMLEDKNGDLWLCTDSKGVWRYDGESFENFTTEEGLINNSVFSVVEDSTGNLWFGTRNLGLCRYDGKSFVDFLK